MPVKKRATDSSQFAESSDLRNIRQTRRTDGKTRQAGTAGKTTQATQPAPGDSPVPDAGDFAACQRSLSSVLRRWRATHKRKIADAAGELGVATATWGHWETEKRSPSLETLHLLARLVGIPTRCMICSCVKRCHFSGAPPFCPLPPADPGRMKKRSTLCRN